MLTRWRHIDSNIEKVSQKPIMCCWLQAHIFYCVLETTIGLQLVFLWIFFMCDSSLAYFVSVWHDFTATMYYDYTTFKYWVESLYLYNIICQDNGDPFQSYVPFMVVGCKLYDTHITPCNINLKYIESGPFHHNEPTILWLSLSH